MDSVSAHDLVRQQLGTHMWNEAFRLENYSRHQSVCMFLFCIDKVWEIDCTMDEVKNNRTVLQNEVDIQILDDVKNRI